MPLTQSSLKIRKYGIEVLSVNQINFGSAPAQGSFLAFGDDDTGLGQQSTFLKQQS